MLAVQHLELHVNNIKLKQIFSVVVTRDVENAGMILIYSFRGIVNARLKTEWTFCVTLSRSSPRGLDVEIETE
jgi:hypothetical protein